ncbi:MAG: hypothetical protein Pg6A_10190 [Termitinemataceae bacterium]|nr:MAG: hypothetical protein Pg6A_10190 [Termitinemataceae bacterium]
MRLVARAEQTSAGLERKLMLRGASRNEARRICLKLIEAGMIDDKRYATLWVSARLRRKAESPRDLRKKLQSKGINAACACEAVRDALNSVSEKSVLNRYVQKKEFSRAELRAAGFSAEAVDSL